MRKKFTQERDLSADNLTMVLMLNGEPMLYLGPLETRQRLQQVASSRPQTTTAITAYAKEVKGTTVYISPDEDEAGFDLPPYGIERRVNPDRRGKGDDPFLETRAGRDRRKIRRPSINISI
jgi:hypothetical protein